MVTTKIIEIPEDQNVVCPVCNAVIVDEDEGLVQQPSCRHIGFVYANGEAFEFDPDGLEERLQALLDEADDDGVCFDPWDWLSAQCGEGDVILQQNVEGMACGALSFTVWIGIRGELGNSRSRRHHLVGTSDEEYSARDRRVFFKPTPLFVRWMKTHHSGQHVFDVGCGTGNTASMLAKAGMKVTAIDLAPRTESEFDVIKADAAEYAFEKGAVLLFCRPCHNGFVEKTLNKGIMCGVADIVYVGLTKNLQDDLGSLHERFTKRRIGIVGHSDERVWDLNIRRLRSSVRRSLPRLSPCSLQ
jgi:hypothetical protein